MKPPPNPHYRHRFPAEIISHAVWLYHVFSLSLRDVELLLAERGIVVSYETVRRWCKKFGQTFANRLRRRRPRPGDKWYLDEVFIRIEGVQHYLWRAVGRWCTRRTVYNCDPHPDLLCDDAPATNGVRASRRKHLVQYHDANGCLGLLSGKLARSQPRSDQCLMPVPSSFRPTIVCHNLLLSARPTVRAPLSTPAAGHAVRVGPVHH